MIDRSRVHQDPRLFGFSSRGRQKTHGRRFYAKIEAVGA
jgi:hypothetical protein